MRSLRRGGRPCRSTMNGVSLLRCWDAGCLSTMRPIAAAALCGECGRTGGGGGSAANLMFTTGGPQGFLSLFRGCRHVAMCTLDLADL
eukprot:5167716-Pyramimonas_sp.AAC.1